MLLDEADLFVLSSIVARDGQMEGVPVALMEALASGAPTGRRGLPGMPELVCDGETGLLAAPGDVADVARALCETLAEPNAARRRTDSGQALVGEELESHGRVSSSRLREDLARLVLGFRQRSGCAADARSACPGASATFVPVSHCLPQSSRAEDRPRRRSANPITTRSMLPAARKPTSRPVKGSCPVVAKGRETGAPAEPSEAPSRWTFPALTVATVPLGVEPPPALSPAVPPLGVEPPPALSPAVPPLGVESPLAISPSRPPAPP